MNATPATARSPRVVSALLAGLVLTTAIAGLAAQTAKPVREQVRIPRKAANVHAGPSSTTIVLLLVPQGTVLPVIERRNEWVVVELSPKLREAGTPMRWYRNETQGFLHESTVETVK